MPQNPLWGSLTPTRFPHLPSLWFQIFSLLRQLLGVGFPLEEQEAHGIGGCRQELGCLKQQRPQTGILPEPHGQLGPKFWEEPLPCPVSPHRSLSHSCRMGGTKGTL